MSGSNWRIGLAFTGLALGFWLFFYGWMIGASLNPEEERYQPYRYASDHPEEIDPALSITHAKALEYREPCKNPKGHDESDLCAQWRSAHAAENSALWTKWGVWIGTIGTIGLFWTLYYTRAAVVAANDATKDASIALHIAARSAEAAQSAANAMRRNAGASIEANKIARDVQRAWISLDINPALFKPSANGAYFRTYFIAKNVGSTAATHFEQKSAIFFIGIDGDAKEIGEKMELKIEEWRKDDFPKANWALAPGDIETDPWWETVEQPEFRWLDGPFPGQRHAQPVFLSAAFYRTIANPDTIQVTWRSWYLHSRESDGRVTSILLDEDYAAGRLCAEPFRTTAVHEQHTTNDGNRHRSQIPTPTHWCVCYIMPKVVRRCFT